MRSAKYILSQTVVVLVMLAGCSNKPAPAPEVSDSIRKSLQDSGLGDVSVKQDRDKGVVTLSGNVPSETEKNRAESLAKSMAGGQVVANEIAVLPPGNESAARDIHSDLDKGIEKNLDAALIQNQLQKFVKYDVKNGVVTLTGDVNTQNLRKEAEKIASNIPNVQQVVNELQIKDQKATTTR